MSVEALIAAIFSLDDLEPNLLSKTEISNDPGLMLKEAGRDTNRVIQTTKGSKTKTAIIYLSLPMIVIIVNDKNLVACCLFYSVPADVHVIQSYSKNNV